jgi:hypothetical protein
MKRMILLLLLVFLVSCSVPSEKVCVQDSDCVPAKCCHAIDAVNQENAPDCSEISCSLGCEEGTLDCGQGKISCIEGSCEVVIY